MPVLTIKKNSLNVKNEPKLTARKSYVEDLRTREMRIDKILDRYNAEGIRDSGYLKDELNRHGLIEKVSLDEVAKRNYIEKIKSEKPLLRNQTGLRSRLAILRRQERLELERLELEGAYF